MKSCRWGFLAFFLSFSSLAFSQKKLSVYAGGALEVVTPIGDLVDFNVRPCLGIQWQKGSRFIGLRASLSQIEYEYFETTTISTYQFYDRRVVLGGEIGRTKRFRNADYAISLSYLFDIGGYMHYSEIDYSLSTDYTVYDFFDPDGLMHHAFLTFSLKNYLTDKIGLETYFQPGIITEKRLIGGGALSVNFGARLSYSLFERPIESAPTVINGLEKKRGVILSTGARLTGYWNSGNVKSKAFQKIGIEPGLNIEVKLGTFLISFGSLYRSYKYESESFPEPFVSTGITSIYGFGKMFNTKLDQVKLSGKIYMGLMHQISSSDNANLLYNYFGFEMAGFYALDWLEGFSLNPFISYEITPLAHLDLWSPYHTVSAGLRLAKFF